MVLAGRAVSIATFSRKGPGQTKERRSGLVLEFLERTFRQKIHHCRQRDHDQGERRVNERGDDGRNVDENGDKIFARHFSVQALELGFEMMAGDRRAQQEKRNGARSRDGGIKRYWKW